MCVSGATEALGSPQVLPAPIWGKVGAGGRRAPPRPLSPSFSQNGRGQGGDKGEHSP